MTGLGYPLDSNYPNGVVAQRNLTGICLYLLSIDIDLSGTKTQSIQSKMGIAMSEKSHRVVQGECINSIAAQTGHLPDMIWHYPGNAKLRAKRGDPDVLQPGDALVIPERDPGFYDAATERRHCYRRKGIPAYLHFQIQVPGEGVDGEAYEFDDGQRLTSGTIGGDAKIDLRVDPRIRRARLRLLGRWFEIELGGLDPLDSVEGQQARLNQLGFEAGPVDGKYGPKTTSAMRAYQAARGIEQTGMPTQATLDRLKRDFGG